MPPRKGEARKRNGSREAARKRPAHRRGREELSSEITGQRGFFDSIAEWTSRTISHAPSFAACVLLIVVWAAWGPFAGFSDTWQLIVNTSTTIVTFLMVALLQNSTRRSDRAVQHKLNALADALGDLMHEMEPGLKDDVRELHEAVGLEKRESAD